MKKILAVVLAVTLVATMSGVALAGNGNNAPTGPHYNLNIIGVSHEKEGMGDVEGGHVIFVELYSSKQGRVRVATDILLSPAPSCADCAIDPLIPGCAACEGFYVLDKNGTDGEASFQLPADVATEWTVWVRGLGKPDGWADMKTCAWDPIEEEWVCGASHVEIRTKGKKTFTDVTSELLYINGVPLFDPIYEDYFWSYHNNGLKLAQLRFYPAE